uniref:Cadherin related family member 2 n=1 Tax=Strigops habroptila TaxID=2489341 RepID=A0A672U8C3_STRHB
MGVQGAGRAGHRRGCSAHLLLVVSGNVAPFFNMTIVYRLTLPVPPGQEAFQLTAIDIDGDPLTYSISGTDAFYFSVNAETGHVTLKQSLDREVSRTLTIIVEDRNDNAPVFYYLPYEASIPEVPPWAPGPPRAAEQGCWVPPVAWVCLQQDTSAGMSPAQVIPDNTNNHWLFYIRPNGNVVLNGSLDYTKNTFYQIKILAKDGGGLLHNVVVFQNSSAYLSLTIIDVPNLDPRFLNEPYSGSVPENCDLGTSVLTVSAMDRDTGVNDEIFYSITNTSVPFAINATTGTITVSAPLDREQLPSEEVLLEAREKNLDIYGKVAQASTLVTVTVIDVNDNKPQFYNCSLLSCNFTTDAQSNFSGTIIEHSSSRLSVSNLNIVAYDPDKGANSNYELYLQGPDASAFTVSPTNILGSGEVQILVQDPSAVDYEISHVMVVQIVANDTGNPVDCCSIATVTIDLIDSNDHIPEFPQSIYSLSVMENSPDGTIIAYDPDSGVLGEITYQLLPESICNIFMVNATTGAVLVRNGSLLDREARSTYYGNLQAKDGGNLVGTTVLEITVLDDNDNAPVVIGSYFISVEEGLNISTQIQANDDDEPGNPNSELGFRILPGPFSNNFTIDEVTGEMHSKEPLDREAVEDERGQMVVTVEVYDHGVPQQSTLVNVTITVGDVNDNAPVFLNQSYEFSVFEDSPGTLVGNVEATDADRTEINSRISFQLQRSSGSSNFLIRSSRVQAGYYMGQLTVDPDVSIDYDTLQEKFFSLVVVAENTAAEEVGDNASVPVMVHILDINDEPPTIQPVSQDIHVSENGTQQGLVVTLVASDLDTNHSLVFEELAVACFKDESSAGDVCWDWFLLAPNGSVLVNSSDIDYELCDTVVLTLRAEDLYTEKGNRYSQDETLRILITDVNDNAPVFLPVTETFGEQLGLVCPATDADSGQGGAISFSIVSVVLVDDNGVSRPFENLFKIVTTVEEDTYIGSIQVASNLDGSLKGQYQVTVEAQDKEAPIFTVDQSYRVRLQFVTTVEEVQSNSQSIKAVVAKSVMEAYFVYSNGTALDANQLIMCVLGRGPCTGTAAHPGWPIHSHLLFPWQTHTV